MSPRVHWILDEAGNPLAEPDFMKWANWFERADRTVAKDTIGDILVSTVFLGVDHSFRDGAPPVLFETMVFGGALDQEQERYCTRPEATAGHAVWVGRVRAGLN